MELKKKIQAHLEKIEGIHVMSNSSGEYEADAGIIEDILGFLPSEEIINLFSDLNGLQLEWSYHNRLSAFISGKINIPGFESIALSDFEFLFKKNVLESGFPLNDFTRESEKTYISTLKILDFLPFGHFVLADLKPEKEKVYFYDSTGVLLPINLTITEYVTNAVNYMGIYGWHDAFTPDLNLNFYATDIKNFKFSKETLDSIAPRSNFDWINSIRQKIEQVNPENLTFLTSDPANPFEIRKAQVYANRKLPKELLDFYQTTNGIDFTFSLAVNGNSLNAACKIPPLNFAFAGNEAKYRVNWDIHSRHNLTWYDEDIELDKTQQEIKKNSILFEISDLNRSIYYCLLDNKLYLIEEGIPIEIECTLSELFKLMKDTLCLGDWKFLLPVKGFFKKQEVERYKAELNALGLSVA